MKRECVLCCAPLKPASTVQCKQCKGVLHAYYCSTKCMKADAARHKDECHAGANVEAKELKDFHNFKEDPYGNIPPPDTATVYRCGARAAIKGEDGEADEAGVEGFEVRRELPKTKAGVNRVATPSKAGVKRAAPQEWDPMAEWKRRYVEGSDACCKPWVNFATLTSVMATWLPPTASSRFTNHTYTLEQREVPDPKSGLGDSSEKQGAWEVCKEAHTGTVPSHWVTGLATGSWMQFRVKTTGPGEWTEKGVFSEPSEPARVGYADYSCMPVPPEGLPASDFSDAEKKFFKTLDTPAKVQSFLDTIPMNHEVGAETNYSALETLRQYHGHCIEGSQLGAYIMSLNGHPPYMMDMIAFEDDCHTIVPFRINGKWGALSVSNHASLRYRNPIYRTIRELMLSYFDDYMNGKGQRSFYMYTQPYHMGVVFGPRWATRRGDVWEISQFGSQLKVYKLLEPEELKSLRPADEMMLATTVSQRAWRCPDNFDEEAARRNENK